jgi:molecular chaperone DnaK (HSP70)
MVGQNGHTRQDFDWLSNLIHAPCSVVAIYDSTGPPRIIKDDDEWSMPSYVHYNGTAQPEVGLPAFEERHADPQNTVRSANPC